MQKEYRPVPFHYTPPIPEDRERSTKMVAVKFNKTQLAKLQALCVAEETDQSKLIRLLIEREYAKITN